MNQLCKMSLFTKQEWKLIFSWLEKSCFLNSALLQNFWIRWCSNILYFLNILRMLNKILIQWFSFDVTTKSLISRHSKVVMSILKNLLSKRNVQRCFKFFFFFFFLLMYVSLTPPPLPEFPWVWLSAWFSVCPLTP